MYMVMFVLDDPNRLDDVIDALEKTGIMGATIVESTGINRRKLARLVGTMAMAGINRLISGDVESHYTLYTILPDLDTVKVCLAAIERVVGDLDQPNTGILAAWPLTFTKGVPGQARGEKPWSGSN